MFGFKKASEPKTTYYRHVCECGNKLFRNVMPLNLEVIRNKDFTTKCFTPLPDFETKFECIKCGTIYNFHGEKEANI